MVCLGQISLIKECVLSCTHKHEGCTGSSCVICVCIWHPVRFCKPCSGSMFSWVQRSCCSGNGERAHQLATLHCSEFCFDYITRIINTYHSKIVCCDVSAFFHKLSDDLWNDIWCCEAQRSHICKEWLWRGSCEIIIPGKMSISGKRAPSSASEFQQHQTLSLTPWSPIYEVSYQANGHKVGASFISDGCQKN